MALTSCGALSPVLPRFLRGPEDDAAQGANSWGARLARRYYSRLFKEYAIADLSR